MEMSKEHLKYSLEQFMKDKERTVTNKQSCLTESLELQHFPNFSNNLALAHHNKIKRIIAQETRRKPYFFYYFHLN